MVGGAELSNTLGMRLSCDETGLPHLSNRLRVCLKQEADTNTKESRQDVLCVLVCAASLPSTQQAHNECRLKGTGPAIWTALRSASEQEPTATPLNVFLSNLLLILVIRLMKVIKQPSLEQNYPDGRVSELNITETWSRDRQGTKKSAWKSRFKKSWVSLCF